MLFLLKFRSSFRSILIAHLGPSTSVYITIFCQYVPAGQLLICFIGFKLFSFIIYIAVFSILLSVDQYQSEFPFVKYKGELGIRKFNCKKELQRSKKILTKRYIKRQGIGDQKHRN